MVKTLSIMFSSRKSHILTMGKLEIRDTLKSTQFVEQWIKYRYGVFDDKGYPGDSLYPGQVGEDENQMNITKQTVLCHGRSIDRVIASHEDFNDINTDNEPERDISPIVRIVEEPSVKYILAIETTSSMSVTPFCVSSSMSLTFPILVANADIRSTSYLCPRMV